jgi:hypothetical protein
MAPEREGQLRATGDGLATPVYRLETPLEIEGEGRDFVLEYTARISGRLELLYAEAAPRRYQLPKGAGAKPLRLHVPLESGSLTGFRVVVDGQSDPAASSSSQSSQSSLSSRQDAPMAELLQIRAVRIARELRGYRRFGSDGSGGSSGSRGSGSGEAREEGEKLSGAAFTAGVEGSFLDRSGGGVPWTVRFPELIERGELRTGHPALRLRYRAESRSDAPVLLVAESAAGAQHRYHLDVKKGEHRIHLYSRALGYHPRVLRLEGQPEGFAVLEASFSSYAGEGAEFLEPLPADMGVILRYPRQEWRRDEWELFRWDLYPSLLVFDFRDYALQAAFLKRLAFFVEKARGAGRLLSDAELAGRHGWNAHDYRAEDLARFFSRAEEEDFPLNSRERYLRRLLLHHGIIEEAGAGYRGGQGGFLSFSQESSARLRHLFATHEGYHGLFFAEEAFRRRVREIWERLEEPEQRFWRRFLAWKTYNTDDTYLVINEFQAYLMQQHLSYVETYFKKYSIPRLLEVYPDYREDAERFLEEYPDHFRRAAAAVQAAAREIAGIGSGDPRCLRPADE